MKALLPFIVGALVIVQSSAQAPAADDPDRLVNQRDETVNNLRHLFLALFDFDVEWGSYPDDDTAKMLKESTGTELLLAGETSNAYFRQLLVLDLVKSERIFQIGERENPAADRTPLGKGGCHFAYVKGLNSARSSKTPVAMAPLLPGMLKFDASVLGGQAVVLRLDGSVRVHPIAPNGDVLIDGKSLFDPEQPFWQGKPPQVALPE